VEIGDGCATVTGDDPPIMPLSMSGWSGISGAWMGRREGRLAARSQDTGLTVLIGSWLQRRYRCVVVRGNFSAKEKDEASDGEFLWDCHAALTFTFPVWRRGEGFLFLHS